MYPDGKLVDKHVLVSFPSHCRLKEPPANIVTVLQKVESDYKHMRDKILAGVPLEQLKPLSVDCEKIITGGSYIPTQVRLY